MKTSKWRLGVTLSQDTKALTYLFTAAIITYMTLYVYLTDSKRVYR